MCDVNVKDEQKKKRERITLKSFKVIAHIFVYWLACGSQLSCCRTKSRNFSLALCNKHACLVSFYAGSVHLC